MTAFTCPMCAAPVPAEAVAGGVQFDCGNCGESGVDRLPLDAPALVVVPVERVAMLERKFNAAWKVYMIARRAYRARVVSRAETDIARNVVYEILIKLERLTGKAKAA